MLQRLSAAMITFLNKFDMFRETANSSEVTIKSFDDVSSSEPNLAYPGDNCCSFYDYRDFGGSSQTGCMPEGSTSYDYDPGSFGDKISSFECGKNVRFEFHNHNSPSTGYEIVSGAGHVRSSRLEHWMEDRVTLIKMSYYDKWTQGSATVWGWLNCEDIGAELPAPSEVGQSYYYTADDAWQRGMKSGEMESY